MTAEQFNAINNNLDSLVLLGCLCFGLLGGTFYMCINIYKILIEKDVKK